MLEANEETHQFKKPKNGNSHDELSVALKNQQKLKKPLKIVRLSSSNKKDNIGTKERKPKQIPHYLLWKYSTKVALWLVRQSNEQIVHKENMTSVAKKRNRILVTTLEPLYEAYEI